MPPDASGEPVLPPLPEVEGDIDIDLMADLPAPAIIEARQSTSSWTAAPTST